MPDNLSRRSLKPKAGKFYLTEPTSPVVLNVLGGSHGLGAGHLITQLCNAIPMKAYTGHDQRALLTSSSGVSRREFAEELRS